MKDIKNWIIGIGGSNMDDVRTYRVIGTTEDVKNHLVSLVNEFKDDDSDSFDYGSTDASSVTEYETEYENGKLYAYACFHDYHIDCTATPEEDPRIL